MNEKLLKNINYFGVDTEKRKLTDECEELRDAITEYEFAKKSGYTYDLCSLREHIIEEFADVMVIMNQIKLYYDIPEKEIIPVMIEKLERQMERIENESNRFIK